MYQEEFKPTQYTIQAQASTTWSAKDWEAWISAWLKEFGDFLVQEGAIIGHIKALVENTVSNEIIVNASYVIPKLGAQTKINETSSKSRKVSITLLSIVAEHESSNDEDQLRNAILKACIPENESVVVTF